MPVLVDDLLGLAVASVCCGGQHAAVLTAAGEVYTWGRGGFGRLGHGDAQTLKAPRRVEGGGLAGVACAQVACGFAFPRRAESRVGPRKSSAEAGRVGGRGRRRGRAVGSPTRCLDGALAPPGARRPFRARSDGGRGPRRYTAAVSRDGALYTWGAGENGRLGLGDVDDRHEPSLVEALWPSKPLARVNAGSVHTRAVTKLHGAFKMLPSTFSGERPDPGGRFPRRSTRARWAATASRTRSASTSTRATARRRTC